MTDPTLRMPNTVLRVVLDLGALPLDIPPLPPRFRHPEFDADWDEEEQVVGIFLGFDDGEFHLDILEAGVEYHFHHADGSSSDDSPWPAADTQALIDWATGFVLHVAPRLPDLLDDADEAAEWHHVGLPVYSRDYGPVPLEIIEVELEGEQLMLPWLGSGHIADEHLDGPDHLIALLWNPEHEEPDIPIARVWLNPKTGEPRARAETGVDWAAVGLTKQEVLSWAESLYLNNHVIGDPAQMILRAALERMAGLGRWQRGS